MKDNLNDKIYTISLLRSLDEQARCMGFYFNKNDAFNAVENNICDLYEDGEYPFAVIEEVHQGIYPACYDYWYEWNETECKYTGIDKPIKLEKFSNFAMG